MKSRVLMVQLCVLALVLLTAGSASASGIYLTEIATPDVGTAGAGMEARAGDASTAFTNAAGMTNLDDNQLVIGIQPIIITAKFDPGSGTTTSGSDGGNAGGAMPAGGIYAVFAPWERVRFGLTVNSYAGLGLDYDDDWVGRYYVQDASLLTLNFSPSVGLKLTDWLSVGGGLNVLYGKLNNRVAVNNPQPGLADGELQFDDGTWGVGGSASVMLQPLKSLRVGITYLSPVELDFKTNPEFSGLGPGLKAILGNNGLLDASLNIDVTLPQQVMVGVNWDVTPDLALLASAGWQNWSQFGKPNIELDAQDSTDLTADLNYKDTFHVALGGRYALAKAWKVSLGAAYDSSPVSDADRGPSAPFDEVWRFGAGVEYALMKNLDLALSYEFLYAGSASIDQQRGPLAGRLQGDYSTNIGNVVGLNVAWTF